MIYFDNAATGGFKPHNVQEVVTTVVKHLCANPTRSGHKLATTGGEMVFKTRKLLAELFNAPDLDRVVFTKNCTEALCTALFGTLNEGDHVITTCMEHNSVLRPLEHLKRTKKISVDYIYPQKNAFITQNPLITFKDVEPLLKKNTRLVAICHASNVTGSLSDVTDIGVQLKKKSNALFLVDAAQSGGHLPIDMQQGCIDLLCLACHKGLGGIMGLGALLFSQNANVMPLTHGGTGSDSFLPIQPDYYPDRLESGTLNLPAIVGLYEGLLHTKASLDFNQTQLTKMSETLLRCLSKIEGVKVFSIPNPCGIVSFSVKGKPSEECATQLSEQFDIAVRGGFHCAPLMHRYLESHENGLVRASLAIQNTQREISVFCRAIRKIAED